MKRKPKTFDHFHAPSPALDWLLFGRGQMMDIPEDHFLNHLKEDQIRFLEKFLELSEDKQGNLLKAFTDIVESAS
jgi:hypothetical protein